MIKPFNFIFMNLKNGCGRWEVLLNSEVQKIGQKSFNIEREK